MITTTLNKIRERGPCQDSWVKLLKHLSKTSADDEPLPFATIVESNGLDDALWCCRTAPEYDKEWRLFSVWCARKVEHLMNDERSIRVLDVAEAYAHGTATDEELDAAEAAAWGAVWDASRDEVRTAAREAAWGTVRNAGWAAAGAAAWVAAWDASRYAARAAQTKKFLEIVGEARAAQTKKFLEIVGEAQ